MTGQATSMSLPDELARVLDRARDLMRWMWLFVNEPGPHESGQELLHDSKNAESPDWLRELLLPLRPAYKQAILLA
jgi:hypothetical protein